MQRSLLQISLILLVTFSFACNREKVNLEGKWEVMQVSPRKGPVDPNDSLSYVLLHFAVGNTLYFNAGELSVNRKGFGEDNFYGLGSYTLRDEGKAVKIDAGYYRKVWFRLRHEKDDQIELLNKRQNVKILLKPFVKEEE